LLQKTGFFDQVSAGIRHGIEVLGVPHVTFLQFTGATVLPAILDNNVVADFAGRTLHGLSVGVLQAMTPVVLEIFVLMTVLVYGESLLLRAML
jgi:hypothetical protein